MSSYNNIEKIKYASEDCVVTLREYIVFENERAEEKYVVFKFANNVSQQLLGMEFEVSQYDIDNNLVEKSVVIYDKFLSKPDKEFVPKAKLKVNYACKTLSVRLIQAAFDRFVWKEGQYLDNSYKFVHYARDEDLEAAKRSVPVQEGKVKQPKPAPAPKPRKGKLPFTAKNATRKNIAKFPVIFNFLAGAVAIAAIGTAIYLFNTNSTAFTLDNFDLKVVDKGAKTVTVTGYAGEDTAITIPAKIEDYTVIKISENAFAETQIKSVTFNSASLYIEGNAFGGCESLKTVSSTGEVTATANAFKNCTALEVATLPNATVLTGCFKGCTRLKYLEYKSTDAKNVGDLFSGTAPKNLTVVTDGKLPDGGDGGDSGSGFVYDPSKTYSYGELNGKGVEGYIDHKSYETVNGEIITINPAASSDLVLEKNVKGISEKVYSHLTNCKSLTVLGNLVLSPDVIAQFKYLQTLDIAYPETVKSGLKNFSKLQQLSLPCYKNAPLSDQYDIPKWLSSLTLKPTAACTYIPDGVFYGLTVSNITVEAGFTACGRDIISYNSIIESITLPNGIYYGEGVIGRGCDSLKTVDVSLSDFSVRYDEFNSSYMYTTFLIVRTEALSGYGYLSKSYNNIQILEIYGKYAELSLFDFVFGAIYSEPRNYPMVYLDLAEEPDGFRTYYKESYIFDI